MLKLSAMLLCDFYKVSHREMYPEGTEMVYSTWTPRASRMRDVNEVVVAGHQAFVQEWLVNFFNENFFGRPKAEVVAEYARVIKFTLGVATPAVSHIEELHDLGYLPLLIKALPEGTIVPLRVPTLTIQNTDKRFFWLTNYIETLASSELWAFYTSATIAHEYRKILDKAAMETVGDTEFVPFQGHDFSMRGMNGLYAAVKSGMGHLLRFYGTDTIPSILALEYYYGANIEKEMVGTSIPASEHSIQCAYGDDYAYINRLITEVHPTGFVSIVSDGYDFWEVIRNVLPSLKDKILARDGRVVIRPDSGDPVKIICGDPDAPKGSLEHKGAVESLWDIFGGWSTHLGYKVLDGHIGLIYGDAITLFRAQEIVDRLKAKGFASINVVFGIGSFTYQYNTRDTFGFALKSTNCVIDGVEKHIFKDPKTDDGTKKSQKGKVVVYTDPASGKITFKDGFNMDQSIYIQHDGKKIDLDMLQPIFENGKVLNITTLAEVRKRLADKA